MPDHHMITAADLRPLIGAPNAPVLIDVCLDEDFALDPRLIPGAVRQPFDQIEASSLCPDQPIVVICQKGLKLSQGAAALLRAKGLNARALTGGMVGWTGDGGPAVPAASTPATRLIAPENPAADTVAAIWLITRFAQRNATPLFVAADAMDAVADRFGGDVVARFEDTAKRLALSTPALAQLASTLRGDRDDTAGVMRLLSGLRALHTDDLAFTKAAMPLFDALHRAYADATEVKIGEGAL